MSIKNIEQNALYGYYYPLLFRYARRLIKEEVAAVTIAKEALQEQYTIDGLVPALQQRGLLKREIMLRCHYWLQAQVFDRTLVTVSDIIKNRQMPNNNIIPGL